MSFSNTIYGPSSDRLVQSSTQKHPLGTRMVLPDGRVFRYAQAGGVTLDAGKLMQESVVISGHEKDMVTAAAAVGDTAITITPITNDISANQYKEGYLYVNDADGEGQMFTVKSHPAILKTVAGVITIEDEDAVVVALTTSTQCGIRTNPYDGVLVAPTSETGIPVGVTPIAVTTPNYFWLQTWGIASVWTQGALTTGFGVENSDSSPGAVCVAATGTQKTIVGTCSSYTAGTEYSLIFLTIAP